MKTITIPEGATPAEIMHGVETVVGAFLDADKKVVLRFEHPAGSTVSVPDAVEEVKLFPGRSGLANHPIADKYKGGP